MSRSPPRSSGEREAERIHRCTPRVPHFWPMLPEVGISPGTSPDTPPRLLHRSARPPPARHPCVSKCRDKSFRHHAASSRPPDKNPAARSAYTDHMPRRNPDLRSIGFPASANPRTSPRQTRRDIAADRDSRCGRSSAHDALTHAAPQSKRCARVRHEETRSATAQSAHDKRFGKLSLRKLESWPQSRNRQFERMRNRHRCRVFDMQHPSGQVRV